MFRWCSLSPVRMKSKSEQTKAFQSEFVQTRFAKKRCRNRVEQRLCLCMTRKGCSFVVLPRELPYAISRDGEASSVVVASPVTLV